MKETVPLMPIPYKLVKPLVKALYPITTGMEKLFPNMNEDLEKSANGLNARSYLGCSIITFLIYFLVLVAIMGMYVYRTDSFGETQLVATMLVLSFFVAFSIFLYGLLYPRWKAAVMESELERNLLFATRHLMIQTSAGVTIFDAIVSVSENYGNPNLDYGAISREFEVIVKEVKGGKELTEALEESASRNKSKYYRRIIWQLANANKAGTDVGAVLKDIVEFLSEEQRIQIRNYGSQLNPLALFYMFMCIIAPTMGLIFLMIGSTFVDIPINEFTFIAILIALVVMQIVFIGLIKSRRPKVAI